MVKQAAVTRIDEYAGWSINQIGVAIVSSRRPPDKAINVIGNLHVTSPQSIITPNFTAKTQRAQRKDNFLLPLRGRQRKKKSIATRHFWILNARRVCSLLLSVLSTKNNKINKLCVLCASNEQSEWAVNYRIKTDSSDDPMLLHFVCAQLRSQPTASARHPHSCPWVPGAGAV